MMGWVGSGEDFCRLGWVQKFWVGLGFEKVTHDQLWLPHLLSTFGLDFRPFSLGPTMKNPGHALDAVGLSQHIERTCFIWGQRQPNTSKVVTALRSA